MEVGEFRFQIAVSTETTPAVLRLQWSELMKGRFLLVHRYMVEFVPDLGTL